MLFFVNARPAFASMIVPPAYLARTENPGRAGDGAHRHRALSASCRMEEGRSASSLEANPDYWGGAPKIGQAADLPADQAKRRTRIVELRQRRSRHRRRHSARGRAVAWMAAATRAGAIVPSDGTVSSTAFDTLEADRRCRTSWFARR